MACTDCLIADQENFRVHLCPVYPGFPCETVAGTGEMGADAGHLWWPHDVAVTAEGDFVIADTWNRRVQRCPATSPGSLCETVVQTDSEVYGIALD